MKKENNGHSMTSSSVDTNAVSNQENRASPDSSERETNENSAR